MPIEQVELFSLHIPFQMSFTHSQAKRMASDSFVVRISAKGKAGYGEAVVRDYVSGSVGSGAALPRISEIVNAMLGRLRGRKATVHTVRDWCFELSPEHHELPVLCAVETAVLDLLCQTKKVDIYRLLEVDPRRTAVSYGGTLPMLSQAAAAKMLGQYRRLDIQNLRVKVGSNLEYNRALLATVRKELGDDFDLRVDANCAWSLDTVYDHLQILADFGVNVVEEPFGRNRDVIRRVKDDPRSEGFTFVADESILSISDLDEISRDGTFGMVNIRLSKNGGLFRSLGIAEKATAHGIKCQLGCHVGETGILSGAGRVAASLIEKPVYVDGSYDGYLLSDNIINENLTFGPRGRAAITKNNGLGFSIDTDKLERLSNDYVACF